MEEHYERLTKKGFHIGVFQSIESLWLSDDGKSVLGQLYLPERWDHKHDSFYHDHLSVLGCAF